MVITPVTIEHVLEAALKLLPQERAAVAGWLLESLDAETDVAPAGNGNGLDARVTELETVSAHPNPQSELERKISVG